MSKPGVVSGVWHEWDGVGGPNGVEMYAFGWHSGLEDAEKSLLRLGLGYSPHTDHLALFHGWVGLEDAGSVYYECLADGTSVDGTPLSDSSIVPVTFAAII